MKACHIYVNDPDHDFDRALAAEARAFAEASAREGFPFAVEVRHARGSETVQRQQIQADRQSDRHPDLVVVIPINQDTIYDLLYETVNTRPGVSCVLLHQTLTRLLHTERAEYKTRLFSVGTDQVEIGRLQARQLAAVLAGGKGDILYVQGRENSFGTKSRMKGLLAELPRTPGVKLNGFRVYGNWTAASVRDAVETWTRMGGQLGWLDAAGAQNDPMALGLVELLRGTGISIPVVGVDGLEAGRRAVDRGELAGTVIQPIGVGHAMATYRDLLTGALRPEDLPDSGNIVLPPESYPSLAAISRRAASRQGQGARGGEMPAPSLG